MPQTSSHHESDTLIGREFDQAPSTYSKRRILPRDMDLLTGPENLENVARSHNNARRIKARKFGEDSENSSFNKPQVPNCPWSMPDPHGGRSGPSEFEPGRIKSAYGLAREREFQCRIDENDATLRMALEVARNKILTGKYGGNSATSRQRQEQYRKNGDAALQAREEAMEGKVKEQQSQAPNN